MSARKKARKKNTSSYPYANVESPFRNEAIQQEEAATFTSPHYLRIHSKRKRLVDGDGVSAKGAIDGIVHSGILPDDSPIFIDVEKEGIRSTQEKIQKGEAEETIIEIWKEVQEDANETD